MIRNKTLWLSVTLAIIGITIGYFASKTRTILNSSSSPTPTPNLPKYQTSPQFGVPTTFISPIRRTKNNKVLVQMKGFLQPKTWTNDQVTINVGDQEYILLLPQKIKLICQPQTQTQKSTNPTSSSPNPNLNFNNSFLDLRAITDFQPNMSTAKIKAFFQQHPQVSLIAEDTGDKHTFNLKLLVGYGCSLNR